MKKILQYFSFTIIVFALLTAWDLISGNGADLSSNAAHAIISVLTLLCFDFLQKFRKNSKKDGE